MAQITQSFVFDQPFPEHKIQERRTQNQCYTGVVHANAAITLHKLPDENSLIQTRIDDHTELEIIAREFTADDRPGWLNVIYRQDYTAFIGWIKSSNMCDFSIKDKTISYIDLPVADYRWNNIADINVLIAERQAERARMIFGPGKAFIYGLVGLMLIQLTAAIFALFFQSVPNPNTALALPLVALSNIVYFSLLVRELLRMRLIHVYDRELARLASLRWMKDEL